MAGLFSFGGGGPLASAQGSTVNMSLLTPAASFVGGQVPPASAAQRIVQVGGGKYMMM